jgi:uncharacterized protein
MRCSALLSLGLAVGLMMAGSPASAQKAPPDQAVLTAAKAVIAASGGRSDALKTMVAMKDGYVAQVRGKDPQMADKVDGLLAKFMDEKSAPIQNYLDEMEAVAINFYASKFTADELNAIAAFQSSATGQKFRKEVPDLMAAMTAPMFRFQKGLSDELQRTMKAQ